VNRNRIACAGSCDLVDHEPRDSPKLFRDAGLVEYPNFVLSVPGNASPVSPRLWLPGAKLVEAVGLHQRHALHRTDIHPVPGLPAAICPSSMNQTRSRRLFLHVARVHLRGVALHRLAVLEQEILGGTGVGPGNTVSEICRAPVSTTVVWSSSMTVTQPGSTNDHAS
jgi:hypothetical protein